MFWRRKRPADDFAEEVRSHLQLAADELKAEGLTEEEARPAARKAFGNITAAEERFYEKGRLVWLDDIHDMARFPRVPEWAAYGRLVTCAQASAGKRYGTSGTNIGQAHLPWAFSEAAV